MSLGVPPNERDSGLDQALGDIVARLRREGRSIAGSPQELSLAIERWKASRSAESAFSMPDPASRITIPESVGSYRIEGVLGVGGMGIVYRAHQAQPRRAVALKMIRPGLINGKALRRFEHEAALLARLNHPGIAQIYEAGIVECEDGARPFIAMELVEGRSLGDYASEQQLAPRDCLALFVRVCDAIAHAHERGVVHRDLKPSNILVEAGGRPKLVDFGVARGSGVSDALSSLTNTGQLIGTVAYMSPEQTTSASDEVDQRTDVYALGVILFEILTRRLPYPIENKSIYESMRIIQHEEPTRLSACVRELRGDLEAIVGKALEKDPRRRYQSAAELSGDIGRYLEGAPILARRPSMSYQARKLALRHRGLVAGLAVAMLVLAAATMISATLAVDASRQRDLARAEADRLRVLEDLQQGMLFATDPRAYMPYVETAAANVGSAYAGRPAAEAAARKLLADYLWRAGEFEQWRTQLDGVAALTNRLGKGNPLILSAVIDTANGLMTLERFREAEVLLQGICERCEASMGSNDPETLRCLAARISCLRELRRSEEAASLAQDAASRARAELPLGEPARISVMRSVALLCMRRGHEDEGIAMLRELVEVTRSKYGDEHARFHFFRLSLAGALCEVGRCDEAVDMGRHTVDVNRLHKGEDHPDTLRAERLLARILVCAGRHAEACALLAPRVEEDMRLPGEPTPESLRDRLCLAEALLGSGGPARAEALANSLLACCERQPEADPILAADATNLLGRCLGLQGRLAESESYLARAVESARDWDADDPETIRFRCDHARSLRDLQRFEEAEADLLACHELLSRRIGAEAHRTRAVARELVELYAACARTEDADHWRLRAE